MPQSSIMYVVFILLIINNREILQLSKERNKNDFMVTGSAYSALQIIV